MDDATIQKLTQDVLSQLGSGPGPSAAGTDLEARVAALEQAVRELARGATAVAVAHVEAPAHAHGRSHPSLQLLGVGMGARGCVVEPDKPCVQSGQCRALGH